MADPLSITAGIIAVAGLALKSTQSLHSTIRGLKSQNKDARALKAEVGDLSAVLESLLETVAGHPDLDLKALVLPLERCAKACAEYESIITRCTRHSGDTTKASLRDWVKQRYLQGDINDFRAALTVYKSTINIALANANL
jgi:predicted component of type VI protein secretion system